MFFNHDLTDHKSYSHQVRLNLGNKKKLIKIELSFYLCATYEKKNNFSSCQKKSSENVCVQYILQNKYL